jgi:hypothetical protein
VSPAHAPTCFGVCKSRHAQNSRTNHQALCSPKPRRGINWRTFSPPPVPYSIAPSSAAPPPGTRSGPSGAGPVAPPAAGGPVKPPAVVPHPPWRTRSSGAATSPCSPGHTPSPARSPCRRWLTRVRSRCAGRRAQWSCRRSSSATLGTRPTLQTCRAPAMWRRSMVSSGCPSRRAGFGR